VIYDSDILIDCLKENEFGKIFLARIHAADASERAIYTTNAIESVNYTIQKIIRHRQSFPNDDAAMKLIFMGLKNISPKWTMPIRDLGVALNQFTIIYGEDRVPL
jgi:transposase-like protein